MITPAGVLQENRQAALDVIEKHQATIAECQHSIEEHNEFIRSLDEAIEQLSRGVDAPEDKKVAK